jgi:iron complex outermembrane receptor protein
MPFTATAEDKGIALEEVVVTATKTERKVEEVPASVTVITAEDIEKMHVTRTEEIFQHVEGVDLRSGSGVAPGMVMLRGISPSFSGATTQVLINGMPIEPVTLNSRFEWNLVSPEQIERIEIVRGPASALYGPNAVGGVINIITKEGKGKPSLSVTGGYGSHDSRSIGASVTGSADKFNFRIGANQYETDGYKRLPKADPSSGSIDLDGRDYDEKRFDTRLGYEFSGEHEISVSANYFDSEGAWYGGHPNYRMERYGSVYGVDYRNRISDILDLKVKVSNSDLKAKYTEDSYDATDPTSTLDLTAKGYTDEESLSGEVQADLSLFAGNTLTVGISERLEELKRYRENATGAQTWGRDIKSEVQGLYLQDEHRFGDKVIITLGGRWDNYRFYGDKRFNFTTKVYDSFKDSDDDTFNPRGGIRFNASKDTSLWASAGTAYVPALNTFKYVGSAFFQDNPDLKPEKSVSYEVGIDQKIGGFMKGKVSLFQTRYEDRISAISVGAATWPKQYRNIGETDVKGAEVGLEAVIADYWYPFINYTYTDAEITDNPTDTTLEGKSPSFTPWNKFNVGLTYDDPRIATVRVAGRYVGERWWSDAHTDDTKLDSFFVSDAKISRRFDIGNYLKDVDLSIAVNNLFNAEYSDYGYNELSDRRNYWVEASVRF